MLGNRVAVSPIVTIEPRRRKFHRPITLTMPLPRAAQKGMLNQYGGATAGDAPTLRLLCSIMGKSPLLKLLLRRCGSQTYLRCSAAVGVDSAFAFVLLHADQ